MTERTAVRMKRFDTSKRRWFSGLVCVGCGSTRLDQNSASELRCYDCSNAVPRDSEAFAIVRGGDGSGAWKSDAESAFAHRERARSQGRRR